MTLGDYVRVSKAFSEAFKWANAEGKVENGSGAGATTSGSEEEDEEVTKEKCAQVNALFRDLKVSRAFDRHLHKPPALICSDLNRNIKPT